MAPLPPDRWTRIDALFEQALDRAADERTVFLRAACGDDPAVYREVEALLASVPESARHFGESATDFAAPLLADPARLDASDDPALGTVVGPYQVVRELGRGGMGAVYLAERADGAFEKTVALKLVKRGMDTDEVLARFRRERQILAGLDHPGIARLLDGGAAADGRPFLVMEVVHGEPLTAWADARRLGVDARLGLFLQAAEAVAYAHRRLVIHRDLKPSNILVARDGADGTPSVKLLDFGIARLLDDGDGAWTQTGHRRLTPAYAAPEQVRGEAVTTATDVYALGVVLYELLAGRQPYAMQGKGLAQIERLLGNPPPRPSTVLAADAAEARGTTPERLARRLRGDLDTIALRALHPDPERRYPSVEALADDLRRHHQGERVLARPDTLGYRARTFVRRHRVGVGAAVAVAVALVGGLGAALWQAGVAERERDLARTEAATAEQVTDFLVRVFEDADPTRAGGDSLLALDVLRRGAGRIEGELAGQPAVQAKVLEALGRVYLNLGDAPASQDYLERTLALRRALYGEAHPETVATLFYLLGAHHGYGYGVAPLLDADPTDSLLAVWETALRRLPGGLGPDEADQLLAVADYLELRPSPDSAAFRARAQHVLALRREALDVYRRTGGPGAARTLLELGHTVDALYKGLGQTAPPESTAAVLTAQGLDLARRLGDRALPEQATGEETLCGRGLRRSEATDAVTHCRAARDLRLRLGGPTHPRTAIAEGNLALALEQAGRPGEAIAHAEAAWTTWEGNAGPDAVMTLAYRRTFGLMLQRAGRFEEAEMHLLASYERLRALRGDANAMVQSGRAALAGLYDAWGRPDEATRFRTAPSAPLE